VADLIEEAKSDRLDKVQGENLLIIQMIVKLQIRNMEQLQLIQKSHQLLQPREESATAYEPLKK
jgi:hypothetical protein